jgi:hypothetical protein
MEFDREIEARLNLINKRSPNFCAKPAAVGKAFFDHQDPMAASIVVIRCIPENPVSLDL